MTAFVPVIALWVGRYLDLACMQITRSRANIKYLDSSEDTELCSAQSCYCSPLSGGKLISHITRAPGSGTLSSQNSPLSVSRSF